MAVRPDDWTLSGICGAVDWTVVQHPAALSPAHLLDSFHMDTSELTQTYPGLYTELTPTVLTGHSTASADDAPVAYATVSSLVDFAKVGPQQLRLRQERYGVPGAYRLLYLTLPSEPACDEWWRALHRLTYSNHRAYAHPAGLLGDASNGGARGGFEPAYDADGKGMLVDTPLSARATAPPPPPPPLLPGSSHDTSGLAELRRLLLYSPPSPAKAAALRPSFHLHGEVGDGPRGSAPMPATHETQQVPSRRSAGPAVAVQPPSDRVLARDAAASAENISVLSSSSAELPRTATAQGPSLARHESEALTAHRVGARDAAGHRGVPSAPPALPAAAARPSPRLPSPAGVPRRDRSRSTSGHAWRSLAPPSPHALLDVKDAEKPLRLDTAALTPSSPAPVPTAAASTAVRPLPQEERRSESEATRRPRSVKRRHKKPPTQPLTADTAAGTLAATAATRDGSLTDLAAALPTPAAVAPAPVTTASPAPVPPRLTTYEPIHAEATSVPRARSAGVAHASISSASSAVVHSLRWYGGGEGASRTPRITYGSGGAPSSWRSPSPRHSRSWSAARLFAAPQHATASRRGAAVNSPGRSRSATESAKAPLRDDDGPLVSPRLGVVAKPHLFLKYTTQPPSLRTSGGGRGAAATGDGVATYLFLTMDEECVVTVPAAQFKQCVADAHLLQHHSKLAEHRGSGTHGGHSAAALSVGVRSFERARHFFGEDHCRGIRVADLERVSRGNEESLLLLSAAQRERFRDLSRIICVVGQTHAFLFEATNSAEAEWYVRQWKTYLRRRKSAQRSASVSWRLGH